MSTTPDSDRTPPSVRELGLWLVFLSTAGVYAWYFWRAVGIGPANPGRVGTLFVSAVVILVALQIAGQITISVRNGRERTDERDRSIALAASRNAYFVLVAGAWCALGVAAMAFGVFWTVHALLLAVVVAELTRWGSQLYYYRRGI